MAQDASAGYWSGGGRDFAGRREVMTLLHAGIIPCRVPASTPDGPTTRIRDQTVG